MKIVPGSSSPVLSYRISKMLGSSLVQVEYRRFPDGEIYVRVPEVEGEDVLIVQSIIRPEDWVTLMLLADACEKASDMIAFIPYMGYARQDRRFREGEPLSISVVARSLRSVGLSRIITVNLHSSKSRKYFEELYELDAMPLLGRYLRSHECVFISPDKGSVERVKRAAETAGVEWDFMEKRRIDSETVEISPGNVDVSGKDVVIIDDIISTGGTVAEAGKALLELGAKRVRSACIHAVLAGNAIVRMSSAGVEDIIATDTIENAVSVISVKDLVGESLKEMGYV